MQVVRRFRIFIVILAIGLLAHGCNTYNNIPCPDNGVKANKKDGRIYYENSAKLDKKGLIKKKRR